jgi:predicted nucleic acid-binding Zn ribbon protein
MESKNQHSLGEVIKTISRGRKVAPGYNEYKVKRWWQDTMGSMINEQTKKLYLNKDTLLVYVDSAALKSELNINKNQLIEKINEYLGEEVVGKIQVR